MRRCWSAAEAGCSWHPPAMGLTAGKFLTSMIHCLQTIRQVLHSIRS